MSDSAIRAASFLEHATMRSKDIDNPQKTHELVVDLLERCSNTALESHDLMWALGIVVATVLSSTKRDEVSIEKIAVSFTKLVASAMEALETLEQDWTRLV